MLRDFDLVPTYSSAFEGLLGAIRHHVSRGQRPNDDFFDTHPLVNEARLPREPWTMLFDRLLEEGGEPFTWTDKSGDVHSDTVIAAADVSVYGLPGKPTTFNNLTLGGQVVSYTRSRPDFRQGLVDTPTTVLPDHEIQELAEAINGLRIPS